MSEFQVVGHSVTKYDALALATGEARFTDDFPHEGFLELALLWSSHAHAEIVSLDTSEAEGVPGVVAIFSAANVPRVLYTSAGQGAPEPSPYDMVLFDTTVRHVGDQWPWWRAESLAAAREAVGKIRVEWKPLPPLFDAEAARDEGAPKLHGGDHHAPLPVPYDPGHNLAASVSFDFGDREGAFDRATRVEEHEYRVQYASHCALEPHAALASFDERGRLVLVSSTQVPFHARRITARVLQIPTGMVRVIKPRIGGGFGGKQEVLIEPLVALAAWRTKRPCRLVLSREEVFVSGRTRHPVRLRLRTGADPRGNLTALDLDALMGAGAYGPHALTVLSMVGGKTLPLFNKIPAMRFQGNSVYTNLPVGGAYRGYGATQGFFALNQQIDMHAREAGEDVISWIKRQTIRAGETSPVFKALGEGKEGVDQIVRSCALEACLDRGAEAIGWKEKRGRRLCPTPDTVRGVGVAVAMQGSAIPSIDLASVSLKMNEDGSFNLLAGAADLGTGADTALGQIVAEVLTVPTEKIVVLSGDTDVTPFDVGAYASSTTYLSGKAAEKAARDVASQILAVGARMLEVPREELTLAAGRVCHAPSGRSVSLEEVACDALYARDQHQIQASASHVAPESPPPFLAQFAEVEVDRRTGHLRVIKFVSAVDCGQPIHPALAEGQVEGAALNGIGYALWEEYRFDGQGRLTNPNFWDYKIPGVRDLPEMVTILVPSSEPSGPFGAKSVSEIGINGPGPAIANAFFDATGVRLFDQPFTPEKVLRALREAGGS